MGEHNAATAFGGRNGRTRAESEPWWPEVRRAPKGAPNIVVILMDDMGYADIGCFGGEIDTPHIDALAARGLRFNHYTTHPICSPARAALLTGRNAHSVSTGWLANNNGGFPGYSGEIPKEAPTLAETLRAQGYGTMMVGKWHNTPTVQRRFPERLAVGTGRVSKAHVTRRCGRSAHVVRENVMVDMVELFYLVDKYFPSAYVTGSS